MKDIITIINEGSSNRRDILRTKLTQFAKTVYQDDDDLVIGDTTVANMTDDGGIIFDKEFSPELAKFIVQCFIFGHSDFETDESDYTIYLGDPNKGGKEVKW